MITLHKLNNDEFILNANIIETVEERPDTTITLTNEKKYIVKEKKDEVLNRIVAYQRKIFFLDAI
ncbi:MAG: flagellar FlbD family protein [Spirochaetes bacterium]|jgi:flagellar protein FlbD|nr:flagellar FlbD family protein [Spirochaetota bacterium]